MSTRVALVTGASRGMGSGIAAGLAESGTTVIGVGRTPLEDWEQDDDGPVDRRICDITDESAVRRLFSEIRREHGRLDILVTNAGAFSAELLLTASSKRFAAVLQTNLLGAHVMTQQAVKLMRPQSTGRVVSISSIATAVPLVGNALYASSKVALDRLMRDYALEFAGSGITFNCLAISFFEHSQMLASVRPEARAAYEARLTIPQALEIREILAAIRYLTSEDARSVSGQVITFGDPT